MTHAWKTLVCISSFIWLVLGPVQADPHTPTLPMPGMTADGMYSPGWFYNSTLDLRKDLAESEKEGKRLVILWEQRECDSCKRMHEVNLRIPRLADKINENFNVVRLNMWGDRKVTDLDGSELPERALAEKYKVNFTPALLFLPESLEKATSKDRDEAEVFRSEGYFKPFHFYFLFHYVQTKGNESEPSFQRWLGNIGRGLSEQNIHFDIWADALPPDLPDVY